MSIGKEEMKGNNFLKITYLLPSFNVTQNSFALLGSLLCHLKEKSPFQVFQLSSQLQNHAYFMDDASSYCQALDKIQISIYRSMNLLSKSFNVSMRCCRF